MLDAAEQALRFCAGRRREDLGGDEILCSALIHSITVVGEAAAKVSQPPAMRCPTSAGRRSWACATGLVHVYFDIDMDVLWQTVTEHLPPLAEQLRAALSDS